jgi:hypothetical protein
VLLFRWNRNKPDGKGVVRTPPLIPPMAMSTNRVKGMKIIAEMFLRDAHNASGSFELCFHKAKTYATALLFLLPWRLLEVILAFLPDTIGRWVLVPSRMWRLKGPLWQETTHFVCLALFGLSPKVSRRTYSQLPDPLSRHAPIWRYIAWRHYNVGWPLDISSYAAEFPNPSRMLPQPPGLWSISTYMSFEHQGRISLDCPTEVYRHVCCDLPALLRRWTYMWSTDGLMRAFSRHHGFELDEVENELRGLSQLISGDIGSVRLLIARWAATLDS